MGISGIKFQFDEAKVREVLTSKGHQLKTWGGSQTTRDPHWIGVTKQTPLHTDPRYPRFSWQLILKVDNFVLRGVDLVETPLKDNTLVLLDTHSPHQLFAKDKSATYYVAVSIDSIVVLPVEEVISNLVHYANTQPINLNPTRITK